jgi:hypothetical protein
MGVSCRCREGSGKVFHVETTACEGEGAWKGTASSREKNIGEKMGTPGSMSRLFADYGSYFWSKKS